MKAWRCATAILPATSYSSPLMVSEDEISVSNFSFTKAASLGLLVVAIVLKRVMNSKFKFHCHHCHFNFELNFLKQEIMLESVTCLDTN